jgi:ankyrin repeat protein
MAAITCRADIISFFLKHGADPYARNADGWTPKEETSSRGAKDMTALIDDFEKRKRATE